MIKGKISVAASFGRTTKKKRGAKIKRVPKKSKKTKAKSKKTKSRKRKARVAPARRKRVVRKRASKKSKSKSKRKPKWRIIVAEGENGVVVALENKVAHNIEVEHVVTHKWKHVYGESNAASAVERMIEARLMLAPPPAPPKDEEKKPEGDGGEGGENKS